MAMISNYKKIQLSRGELALSVLFLTEEVSSEVLIRWVGNNQMHKI